MSLPSNTKRKIFDGRYEILSIVGRGADSVVYHGRHITGAAQEVAIKVLINRDGTTTLTDKLRREALTLVSCRHKYVVRLDDFHSIQDLCYLSMEYAKSGDLLKFIATLDNKRLSPDQVALFLRQCLEAIDFVHATGVIHRDLKPENILVASDKEIRLADFGLALLPGDDVQLEELRNAVGSFDYLAPEVLDGIRYDTVSDLYSLGVCFYEAATGKHPFSHAPIADRRDARRDARIIPLAQAAPELPAHVAAVITNLMRFSAHERFQSASEALQALGDQQYRASPAASAEQIPGSAPANDDRLQSETDSVSSDLGVAPVAVHAAAVTAPMTNSDITTQQPAAVVAETASRQSNPTEKIDLERIKAIIARDTQRHSGAAISVDNVASTQISAEVARRDTTLPPPGALTPAKRSPHAPNQANQSRAKGPNGFGGSRPPLFATALLRFVGVSLAFALLTVGGLYSYHFITSNSSKKSSTATQHPQVTEPGERAQSESAPSANEETVETRAVAVQQLPEGVYPGVIQGLFPGPYVPMALVTDPKQHQITLLVGLEGWIPATVAVSGNDTVDSEGPTFRSNGLILKFNQESSATEITGTVIDVVTGDAGTWKISR
jgi:serine/threonine protein kinase